MQLERISLIKGNINWFGSISMEDQVPLKDSRARKADEGGGQACSQTMQGLKKVKAGPRVLSQKCSGCQCSFFRIGPPMLHDSTSTGN